MNRRTLQQAGAICPLTLAASNITRLLAGAVIFALTGAPAMAQSGALEEVIVTATKRTESLQDIPVTVNAITADTLQDAGVVNLADIAHLVPTLTVSTNLSPFATGIRIRGIGTSQNNIALEASVAFVVDGIYLGRSGLGMSDLTDIERVEVLQGPQGTLYGKNANAGVISVVTKNPDFDETGGYVQATAGDYGLQQYTASLTGPVNDEFAYLFAGNWRQQDGWLENDTGPDQMSEDGWNLRGKLQWQPRDELSVMLTGSHVDRDDRCCAADALQTDTFLALLAANDFPVPKNDAYDWENNIDQSTEFTMSSDMAILTVDYALDQFQLTSLSAWNAYDFKSSADADRSEFDILSFVDDKTTGSAFSQEFRLSSDLEGPLQYLGGLYYLHEENKRDNPQPFTFLGEDIVSVGRVTFRPQIALIAAPGDYIAAVAEYETDAYAAFGQTTYSFTEEWLLTVGLRYTAEEKSIDGYVETFSSAPAAAIPGIPTFVELIATPGEGESQLNKDSVTGLASLRYFVSADTMVFASSATGAKSPGFNAPGAPSGNAEFSEETTNNYELGVKSQLFDDRLKLNATAFYSEFDDLQFLAQLPVGAGTYVSNAAKATTQGIDLGFTALPLPNLILDGGVQYLDAQYSEGELEQFDVVLAPDWSGSLAATLVLPIAAGNAYLRTDYSFMGDHYTNPTYQPPETKQDRELVNVRLGWRNDSWDAAIWARNITDESYSTLAAAPFLLTGMTAQFLQPPRTYGVTLRYSF
ncbi:MAG: TonB-dependent receptor [Halioglobus sp.]|nr:TonB-dependent receptor [Halioglobus sp.]